MTTNEITGLPGEGSQATSAFMRAKSSAGGIKGKKTTSSTVCFALFHAGSQGKAKRPSSITPEHIPEGRLEASTR